MRPTCRQEQKVWVLLTVSQNQCLLKALDTIGIYSKYMLA